MNSGQFLVSQKAWREGNLIQILFSLMTIKDLGVVISLTITCLSVWPHFPLKTESISSSYPGQSAFDIL
jgi:hypothetical protein